MKMQRPHSVPLSDQAVALLKALKQQKLHDTLVCPSRRQKHGDKTMLSDMALTKLLGDVNAQSDTDRVATPHGFRSSFRDWASKQGYAREQPPADSNRNLLSFDDLLTDDERMSVHREVFATGKFDPMEGCLL